MMPPFQDDPVSLAPCVAMGPRNAQATALTKAAKASLFTHTWPQLTTKLPTQKTKSFWPFGYYTYSKYKCVGVTHSHGCGYGVALVPQKMTKRPVELWGSVVIALSAIVEFAFTTPGSSKLLSASSHMQRYQRFQRQQQVHSAHGEFERSQHPAWRCRTWRRRACGAWVQPTHRSPRRTSDAVGKIPSATPERWGSNMAQLCTPKIRPTTTGGITVVIWESLSMQWQCLKQRVGIPKITEKQHRMKVFNLGWVTHGRENASCIMRTQSYRPTTYKMVMLYRAPKNTCIYNIIRIY